MQRRITATASHFPPYRCYHGLVDKFLLLSIVLATFVAPVAAAGQRNPRKALRNMLAPMIAAELAYALFLRYWRSFPG
jgi:hypothetical protein